MAKSQYEVKVAAAVQTVKASSVKSRLNNFDFLRLFFAIGVIFSHSFPLGVGSSANEPFNRITRGQTTGGLIAVDCFFIMSGYLITGSFMRSSGVLDYLGKRIRRIYPGFVVAMLFDALVIVPLAGGILLGRHKIVNLALNSLLLREASYTGAFLGNPFRSSVNCSLWTIFFEFGCYILVLILGISGALFRRKIVSGLFLASVLISIVFNVRDLNFPESRLFYYLGNPSGWARLIPVYLAGVVAYLYRDQIRYTVKWIVAGFFALLVACFVPFGWAAVFPFAGTYLLFWIQSIRSAFSRGEIRRLFLRSLPLRFPVAADDCSGLGQTDEPIHSLHDLGPSHIAFRVRKLAPCRATIPEYGPEAIVG